MDETAGRLVSLVPESWARATGKLGTIHRKLVSALAARWHGYAGGAASVVLVTFCAYGLHLNLSIAGSLCFLIVVLASGVWGFWEGSVTSLIALGCLNCLFVPPVLSWAVYDPQNWVALAAFEITALTVGRLSTRVHSQARAEARHRVEIEKLYDLSRRILFLDRRQRTGAQLVSLIQEVFHAKSVAIFDATLARVDATGPGADDLGQLARRAYFQDCTLEGKDARIRSHVLRLGSKPAGAIAFSGPEVDLLTIEPIASLAAIALERARSFENESRADAARQAEQLRTAVLDALAHAFKTPLTAILTASSGLLEVGRLCADDAELAALIDEQAEHLNRLTSELLQMARLDTADVRLRRERISVHSLIEDVVARYREQLGGRRVNVPDPRFHMEVYGDRAMISSALEQFVDNACRYSTPGSPISVVAEESPCEIVIAVHNEGPAIRPADRERIFERFYRAEESRHRAPGTGLGLSIAKKAAQAHDGRTWVVSEEHSGTTFFFALPCGIRRQSDAVSRQDSDRG